MSTATMTPVFPALLDQDLLAVARRRLAVTGRAAGLVAGGFLLASTLWLILAGPGFITDGASTATPRGRLVAHR